MHRLLYAFLASMNFAIMFPARASAPFFAPKPAYVNSTTVSLRIESANNHTIYEAPIFTSGHNVTTPSGGTHHCDGTNLGANPTPGPTCTSALDDASKVAEFPWDATYWAQYDDFFITSIANTTQTSTQYWGILLNYQYTPVGGCQQQVAFGDHILIAFDAFNKKYFLELSGPKIVNPETTASFDVIDGMTGSPVAGAAVVDASSGTQLGVSDGNGAAQVFFGDAGTTLLKARKNDAVQSNGVAVVVG
ncbi:hypothetical protein GLOTRDRAFT_133590 [Gloeophyllum trabeum ATCC 11539]|uniref:Uncharacterized protein n=1 Tax=Gloeophyllum trabeum (strain ATCC 11539 / FP-39264 / Madison 617) TaxID=670483 RepID=S7PSQ0_GLOTA|nr:uncharacterized protein GLOTRDRAFT_133590 [Gloeophyllum trabeum ATCC 11539]EPQ50846.1 hypothetical protein GLOTRDRAFT_133590 [Gloeophyllum trabeum ATCC 11539]